VKVAEKGVEYMSLEEFQKKEGEAFKRTEDGKENKAQVNGVARKQDEEKPTAEGYNLHLSESPGLSSR